MFQIYDLLPLILRLRDAEASGGTLGIDPILKRITDRLLQDETDTHAALVAAMKQLYDCLKVDNPYRVLLFEFLGQQVADGWTESLERFMLCTTIPWHRISGTVHGWSKAMVYRVAGSYNFSELYKTEPNESGDYNPDKNATFPFKSARIALSPVGLFPYDWSTDTLICVPPSVPGSPPATVESPTVVDYNATGSSSSSNLYGTGSSDSSSPGSSASSPVSLFFSSPQTPKIVSDERGEDYRFGQAVEMNLVDSPYLGVGPDLFVGEPNWTDPATGFFRQGRVHRYQQDDTGAWVRQQIITGLTSNPVSGFAWSDSTEFGSTLTAHKDYLWVSHRIGFSWIFQQSSVTGDYSLVGWADQSKPLDLRNAIGCSTHKSSGITYAATLGTTPLIGAITFQDTFTDTDNTVLSDHIADSGPLIASWRLIESNPLNVTQPVIVNNQANSVAGASGGSIVTKWFAPDSVISGDVTLQDADYAGFVAHGDIEIALGADGDYLRAVIEKGFLTLYWRTPPTQTMADNGQHDQLTLLAKGSLRHSRQTTYHLVLTVAGNGIKFESELETITASFNPPTLENRHGVEFGHEGVGTTPATIDNLLIRTIDNPNQTSLQLYQETTTHDGFELTGLPIVVDDVTSLSASDDFVAVGMGQVTLDGLPWVGQVNIYQVYESSPDQLDLKFVKSIFLPEQSEAISQAILDAENGPQFGQEVHLNGPLLAITTKWPHTDVPTSSGGTVRFRGSAYLYHDPVGDGSFRFFQRLIRKTPEILDGDGGTTISLIDTADSVFVGDGYVAVGSREDNWDSNFQNYMPDPTGSVTLYEGLYSYNGYLESQVLTPPGIFGRQLADASPTDTPMDFCYSLAGVPGLFAVGAPGDNFDEIGLNEVVDTGAVYLYDNVPPPAPLPDTRQVVVCSDFAVLPVGGLDVAYQSDDTTSVVVLNDQLPPQTVLIPPDTFIGPFDLIGVRFRAWVPQTATMRIRTSLTLKARF